MTDARRIDTQRQSHGLAAPSAAARPASPIYFRSVTGKDRRELLALTAASRELHTPWIAPPMTAHMFKIYLRRTQRDDHDGYLICRRDDDRIVGVINVNNVVKGTFLSASLAYYAAQGHAGKGYMREGLQQVKQHLFRVVGLHRVEANIQPQNQASIALVRSCGFEFEGLAREFLFINGAWRDHERWVAIDKRRSLR